MSLSKVYKRVILFIKRCSISIKLSSGNKVYHGPFCCILYLLSSYRFDTTKPFSFHCFPPLHHFILGDTILPPTVIKINNPPAPHPCRLLLNFHPNDLSEIYTMHLRRTAVSLITTQGVPFSGEAK